MNKEDVMGSDRTDGARSPAFHAPAAVPTEAVVLQLSARQYADVREGLAFLSKTMALRPDVRAEAVLSRAEIGGLVAAMDAQASDVELAKMLLREGRKKKACAQA